LKYLLLIPALIFFILFTLWPLATVIQLSVYKTNFITSTFVGLDNYISSFKDPAFILAIINSLVYSVLLVIGIALSLALALNLYKMSKRWQDTSRIILYLPVLSAGIIISLAWKWIFQSNGVINWLLNQCGAPSINWFGQGLTAIPVIAFITMLSGIGSNTIILLAVVQNVNKDYLDAAMMDGASWRIIKNKIIIPIIAPTIYMMLIGTILGALTIFEFIYILAPYDYTSTMAFSIFKQGFEYGKYGIAAAQAIILLVVAVVLYRLKKRWER